MEILTGRVLTPAFNKLKELVLIDTALSMTRKKGRRKLTLIDVIFPKSVSWVKRSSLSGNCHYRICRKP